MFSFFANLKYGKIGKKGSKILAYLSGLTLGAYLCSWIFDDIFYKILNNKVTDIGEVDMRDKCIQEFIRNAKQYIEMPKLTPELIRVFIRRIEVYEKFEKYSRTAGNPIRIHYAFRLPEQEGVPAMEVLAQSTAKTA